MSNLKKLCEFPNDGYVYFTPVGDITYNYVYFNNVIYYNFIQKSLILYNTKCEFILF